MSHVLALSALVLAGLSRPLPPEPARARIATLGSASARPSAPVAADRGRVTWFEGTFEQALAEAARTKKLVFVDLWATWCGWCKRFDHETLNDTAVVAELKELICVAVDADGKEGQPLMARFGISGLPGLVFLEPDGSLRDRLNGFRAPEQFVGDVLRIKAGRGTLGEVQKQLAANPKDVVARLELALRLRQMQDPSWNRELDAARELVARDEGFDAASPEARYAIARKLRACGDMKGYEAQIAAIQKLDPEGKSVPMRRLALERLVQGVHSRYQNEHDFDPSPVKAFIATEPDPHVRFDGWTTLRGMASYQAEAEERRGQSHMAAALRSEGRAYGREAWKDCPSDRVAEFGRELALSYLAQAAELTAEERTLAPAIAAKVAAEVPASREAQKTLADCLDLAERREEAAAVRQRLQPK